MATKFVVALRLRSHNLPRNFRNLYSCSNYLYWPKLHNSSLFIPFKNDTCAGKRLFHTSSSFSVSRIFSDETNFKKVTEEVGKCEFPVRYMEFTACQSLYLDLIKIGENRPYSGVKLNLAYIDTNPEADKKTPVVVCLHGTPGGHWDFNEITSHLHKKGVRVIAINYPGYGWTRMDEEKEFTSTPEEKAVLVKEFLELLGIHKVDLGIVHSAGVYPGLILTSEDLDVFKSLLMINPGGLGYHKVLRPFWYLKFHARFYRNLILRPLLLLIVKAALVGTGFGNTNAHQMSVALESLTSVPYEEYKSYPKAMVLRGVPSCLIYSLTDRVVESRLSKELSELLQCENTTVYDGKGNVKETSGKKVGVRAFGHIFEGGGHFSMKRYPDVVNKIVEDFLNIVSKKDNNVK